MSGIPDLAVTKGFNYGLAALLLTACMGMIAAMLAPDVQARMHGHEVAGALILFVVLVLACAIVVVARHALANMGAWCHVDEQGMHYGTGPEGAKELGVHILWSQIAKAPTGACDVRTEFMNRRAITKNLVFWYQKRPSEIVEHRLPLRITTDTMRCIRYTNKDELLRAILLRLASRPGLQFDASVFVDAAIHPETWKPMRAPRRVLMLMVCALAALIATAVFFIVTQRETLSLPLALLGIVVFMVAGGMGISVMWLRCFPWLSGIFEFRDSRSDSQTNPITQ